MIKTAAKLITVLTKKERKRTYWLIAATFLVGLIESSGIFSIAPFIGVLVKPDIIGTNQYLSGLYRALDAKSYGEFQALLGFVFFIVLVTSNVFAAFFTWHLQHFLSFLEQSLSERLLTNYLRQPYLFFVNRNSSDLIRNIHIEVNRVVLSLMQPVLLALTKTVLVVFIVCLLAIVDPLLTVVTVLVLGGMYALIFYLIRKRLSTLTSKSYKARATSFMAANEALDGIKELKLLGGEDLFLNRYSTTSKTLAMCNSINTTFSLLPKYLLEIVAFGGILLIVLFYLGVKQDVSSILPVVALYTFAGYRIIPSFQIIFSSLTLIRYNQESIDMLYSDFISLQKSALAVDVSAVPLVFSQYIELRNVSFSYPGATKHVVDDLNIRIAANSIVGIVGLSGSGKTTMVDIILGLIPPSAGKLVVDGTEITPDNVRCWQKILGYVPQSIYLADTTIAENIAFGVPAEEIDHAAVERAARSANLHGFIVSELPDGYSTLVGERGVRLSGGQRQRIGIARSLYAGPGILILDEATSALDAVTEKVIMDDIFRLHDKKTIIMIAHRVSSLRRCDVIYLVEEGQVVDHGLYADMLKTSDRFRKLANVSAH